MLLPHQSLFVLTLITSWLVTAEPATAFTTDASCPHQPYKVHIFSRRPLLMYIEDFVSLDEAAQLVSIAEPNFKTSDVFSYETNETTERRVNKPDTTHRLSNSTILYSDDSPPTNCIRKRAATFQGIEAARLEHLQVVRYSPNGFFNHHYDWIAHDRSEYRQGPDCKGDYLCDLDMGDRESTFFVFLQADCEGGETDFPSVGISPHLDSKLWCEFINCENDKGVKWKPKAGNALFWENLDEHGKGMQEVLHAGLPVLEGIKIGLNIWTRQRMPRAALGQDGIANPIVDGIVDGKDVTYNAGEHESAQVISEALDGHSEL